MDKNTQV